MNLNEEVRDDYLVSAEIKKLWSVQMDILSRIDEICEKHDIKYFADGGTLLGAVRHKGFIPWDDDLDILMFKDDLDKFIKYAKEELKDPYFLQTWETEEGFYPWHVKIRKSDTACYTDWEIEMNPGGNHGIFVDIFPAYNVPDSKFQYKLQTMRLKRLKFLFECYQTDRALSIYNAKATGKRKFAKAIWKVCSVFTKPDKICRKFIKAATVAGNDSKKVGYVTFLPGTLKYTWDRHIFDEIVDLPFEDRTIHCPKGYDERLTGEYGDWHKIVKSGSMHSTLHFSSEMPYGEYLKTLKK